MAWLDENDLEDWVEVVNYDGDFLGWIKAQDARHLKIPINLVKSPPLYKEHPFVINHAILAGEMGLLKAQDDSGVSEVQKALIASNYMRKREREEDLRVKQFEENLFVNDQERFRAYKEIKEEKEVTAMDGVMVEERVPQNIEEFLAALGAFTDEVDSVDNSSDEGSGWLDAFLSDDELDLMGE